MTDDEALQILSNYVQGCGGELCAGWRARPIGKLNRLHLRSIPPQDFKPVRGQKRRKEYNSFQQVALAMGLNPNRFLAASVTWPARKEMTHTSVGARNTRLHQQDTDMRAQRRTNLDAGLVDESEAASGPTEGQNVPVQMPHMQASMRSTSSSQDVRGQVARTRQHDVAEQPNVAVALQPNLEIKPAAKPGKRDSWQPMLPPANGMHQSPGGQHPEEEIKRLQHENRELKQQKRELKQRNETLELKVKDQQSHERAREKEMRAQQVAHSQTVNNLFNQIRAMETADRIRIQVKQEAICVDSD